MWKPFAIGALAVLGAFPSIGYTETEGGRAGENELSALRREVGLLTEKLERLENRAASDVAAERGGSTAIGGYGEAVYSHYRSDSSRSQADLKRFVLFVGHRFNDQLTFESEVEWEHAITSAEDQGEVAVEQAFLSYQFAEGVSLKTGLLLMPFGFVNTAHEPPVFHGVERNEVETRIIPSTWREGGVALTGTTDFGLTWNMGVTTGFNVAAFDDASAPLAASHQELQLARARDLGYHGALNYRGIPGVTVGGALFTGNSFHSNAEFKADPSLPDFSGIRGRVTLWELHTRWQQSGLDLQALYAKGRIGEADRIDAVLQSFNTANGTDRPFVPTSFYGWLVQGAYTLWQNGDKSLTPFARYEKFDTQSRMPGGFLADPIHADRVATAGVSFKLHPQMVFKADYQWFMDNRSNNRFNLGLGYMF